METIQTIDVEIEGKSPLLMNKFNIEALKSKTIAGSNKEDAYGTPEEQAEKTAYWMSNKKELCIPSEVLMGALLNASKMYKVKGKSVTSSLAGTVKVEPFEIPLGTNKYEVDARGVVISSGMKRSRVIRCRAKVSSWKAKFQIIYDKRFISDPEILKAILEDAGQRIGIMDFSPRHRGSFGCFLVKQWKIAK